MMRRTLSQTAWAAIATKGSEAQRRFRVWRPKIGPQKAAWAVAHYQLRVVWKVLHDGVRYRQRDTEELSRRALARAKRTFAELRKLGYEVSIRLVSGLLRFYRNPFRWFFRWCRIV